MTPTLPVVAPRIGAGRTGDLEVRDRRVADGTHVDGPVALRNALSARPDVFVGTITEKLMIYGLGRGLEPVDMPVVRSVLKGAARDNYAMHSIVLGIVQSAPFQMRTKLGNTVTAVPAVQTAAKE